MWPCLFCWSMLQWVPFSLDREKQQWRKLYCWKLSALPEAPITSMLFWQHETSSQDLKHSREMPAQIFYKNCSWHFCCFFHGSEFCTGPRKTTVELTPQHRFLSKWLFSLEKWPLKAQARCQMSVKRSCNWYLLNRLCLFSDLLVKTILKKCPGGRPGIRPPSS